MFARFRWLCWGVLFLLLTEGVWERKNDNQFRESGDASPSPPDTSSHFWYSQGLTWQCHGGNLMDEQQGLIALLKVNNPPEIPGQVCRQELPSFAELSPANFCLSMWTCGSGSAGSGPDGHTLSCSWTITPVQELQLYRWRRSLKDE